MYRGNFKSFGIKGEFEMGTVEITIEEYRELILKAYKYDKLREIRVNINNWDISDEEAVLFDVSEEERKAIKERRPF